MIPTRALPRCLFTTLLSSAACEDEDYSCTLDEKGLRCEDTAGSDAAGDCGVGSDTAVVHSGGVPYCVDGRTWAGDEDYCFYITNPGCQADPMDEAGDGTFLIDADSFTDVTDAGISDVSLVATAFDTARTEWNYAGSNVTVHAGLPGAADVFGDENTLQLSPARDARGRNYLAIATMEYSRAAPERGATGCDVLLYSMWLDPSNGYVEGYVNWDFTDDESLMGIEEVSMPSVLLHEVGHCLGFAHNVIADSVMAESLEPGHTLSLSYDDRVALDYLYP